MLGQRKLTCKLGHISAYADTIISYIFLFKKKKNRIRFHSTHLNQRIAQTRTGEEKERKGKWGGGAEIKKIFLSVNTNLCNGKRNGAVKGAGSSHDEKHSVSQG